MVGLAVDGGVAGGSFSACGSLTKLLESTSHACKKLATVGGVVGLAPCDDTPSNQVRRQAGRQASSYHINNR